MFSVFRGLGGVAALSLLIAITPAIVGASYAIRPSESKLALMRPFSLAGLFSALAGMTSGLISLLHAIDVGRFTRDSPIVLVGLAESLVPLLVSFGCLTIAWLCVALGMRRQQ